MLLKTSISTFLLITFISFSAHSALITSIKDLDIGGTKYNVTFHAGKSFNQVFDADADGIFREGDASIVDHAPTFFGNKTSAEAAAAAIIAYLGNQDGVARGGLSDRFYVPFDELRQADVVNVYQDTDSFLISDSIAQDVPGFNDVAESYATFELAANSVPNASTLALAGLALVLMGVGRRRRA